MRCVECDAPLPEEIEAGTGVYCPECGLGQHVPADAEDEDADERTPTLRESFGGLDGDGEDA